MPPILPLRQFLEISTGAGKGRVPWTELQRAQGDYIEPKYLPKEVTLKQYYHLCQDEVNALLDHWTQRQAAGEVPFSFRKAVKAIRQKKRALKEIDADVDMGSGEEADSEEDQQDDDDSQVWGDGASQGDGGSDGSAEQAHPGQSLGDAAENPSRVSSLLKNGDSRH